MDENRLITDVTELWDQFSRLAHFEDTAYDIELKNTIIKNLKLSIGDIPDQLKQHDVTCTALLSEILKALEPFSLMINDLLRIYETAGAKSNNNNIQIEFDFNGVPKEIHLDAFREQVENVQTRISYRSEILKPWDLINLLQQYDYKYDNESLAYNNYNYKPRPNGGYPYNIQTWLEDYENDQLPDQLPVFPEIHWKQMNEKLKQLFDLAKVALQLFQTEYNPVEGRKSSIRKGHEKYQIELWCAERDDWMGAFVRHFFQTVKCLDSMSENERDVFESALDQFLSSDAIKIVTFDEQYKALCDILSMPFWKHRYELYSAWVFTCISDAISDLDITYHVENGVLSFRFSGSLLATLHLPGVDFEIWAEKRHPAVNPVGEGRKDNIQPDYSIVKRYGHVATVCMLIECKQYKRPDNTNFANAVNDYAIASPSAKVFLTNYGRISKKLILRLKTEIRNRYVGYSFMHPGNKEVWKQFVKDIREDIEANWLDVQTIADENIILWDNRPEQVTIELSWGTSPCDLDLKVRIMRDSVDEIHYHNKGSLEKYPYAQLDQDVVRGPGKETITLGRLISSSYEIYINNYSGEEQIDGEIQVKVSNGEETICYSKAGVWDRGRETQWHVGNVNALGVNKTDAMEFL